MAEGYLHEPREIHGAPCLGGVRSEASRSKHQHRWSTGVGRQSALGEGGCGHPPGWPRAPPGTSVPTPCALYGGLYLYSPTRHPCFPHEDGVRRRNVKCISEAVPGLARCLAPRCSRSRRDHTWKPSGEDAKKGSDWNFEWTGPSQGGRLRDTMGFVQTTQGKGSEEDQEEEEEGQQIRRLCSARLFPSFAFALARGELGHIDKLGAWGLALRLIPR